MYIFIVNPIAGSGRSMKIFERIKASKIFNDLNKEVYFTNRKGHAGQIVKDLADNMPEKIEAIIIVGGDGTMNDAINGIHQYPIKIGFIPGGSGNDFARGCKIERDPLKVLEMIIKGRGELDYWLGNYHIQDSKKKFANNIGFGFDAEVAKRANESKYKAFLSKFGLGNVSYLFALIHILFSFKPKTVRLLYDGKERTFDNCWMITIGNHPYFGGGMKIIPTAKIQSKVFPILIVHSISKLKILTLFLTVYTGRHLKYKEVELFEAEKLTISSKEKLHFHADGETSICKEAVIYKERENISILGSLKNLKK